ncbi:MAG: N-acetyl-D-Glu racemase DgcA [Betaproteobacteria bacterium]|jgi:L-alanine-DL-glutamate epimerase-like enolase superfamily enzyme
MKLDVQLTEERWAMREPFEIAGQVIEELPLLLVEVRSPDGTTGRAEAAGVDYDGETPQTMCAQVEGVADRLRDGITGADLMQWLPRGGARNALDCALWDWRAKRNGVPAWQAAGLAPLKPLLTACTVGLGTLADTRRRARALAGAPLVKVKVDGQRHLEQVHAVRGELPQVRLIVDANQSWSCALLERLLPELVALGVEMVEQPVPRGQDEALARLASPLPLVADESCTDRGSLPTLVGRYQGVNIKLDKTGGLTEALALAREARTLGLDVMVGNMCGTSLGMAPAFLVAQLARWVDLDGPLFQTQDRDDSLRYEGGTVHPPRPELWG